jgi:T-complex protein 1 subunit delta
MERTVTQHDSEKSKDVRMTNITAARAVADVVRTSLGPRGMDKMVSKHHFEES